MPVDGSYAADVLPGMILASLGMGAVFMPLTLVATTGLKNEDQGLASGSLQHVAAGRRRARARDPLDDRGEPHERPVLGGRARDGFHCAFAGAASSSRLSLVVMRRAAAQAARRADRGRGRDGAGLAA